MAPAAVLRRHCAESLVGRVAMCLSVAPSSGWMVMEHHRDFGLIHCLCQGRAAEEALPGVVVRGMTGAGAQGLCVRMM